MTKQMKLAIGTATLAILLYPFFQAHEQATLINKICSSNVTMLEVINTPDAAINLLHRECE